MTNVFDLERWFDAGTEQGATHMVVACDTFDYTDYPVYVTPRQNVQRVIKRLMRADMTKLMEVYDLRLDKAAQLAEDRAYHI